MFTHQFPLVAEAESADRAQGGRTERRGAVQDALVAEAGLSVQTVLPQQQHVGQVGDVAGGQAQRLDLGELPVGGLGGDERAQRGEGRVHAVRPVPLPRVGRLPLLARSGQTRFPAACSTAAAAAPPPPPPPRFTSTGRCRVPLRLPRLPARAAAAGGLPVGAVAAAVQVVQVGGEAVGLRAGLAAGGLHPGAALVGLELLGSCGRAAAAHHFILRVKIAPGAEQVPPIRWPRGLEPAGPRWIDIPGVMNDGCFLGRQPPAEEGRHVEPEGDTCRGLEDTELGSIDVGLPAGPISFISYQNQ